MAGRYHLKLLGGFALADEAGREHALPSRRAAALLACLGVEAPTPRAELAARLWPGQEHADARRNLRRELARLREAGLHGVLDGGVDDLALAPGVATDLATVVDAARRGEHATALAAWGGPLLAGFALAEAPAFEAWLQAHRSAWANRWREWVLAHIEKLENAGALHEALHWNERLRTEDPLHEGHHTTAMRLHHRLGEPAAALEVYARLHALLRSELGVAPAPVTQALAERLRAAEQLAPQLRRGARAAPESIELPLIGRDAPAAALLAATAPVLLLHGEPGVGKTRLVHETLRAATTLAMPCAAETRHCALYPVGEALQAALASPLHAERLAGVPAAVRREAARLVPALGEGPPAGPAEPERMFEALADLIDALATPAGVLWIDDLHDADEATLELLALLAHRRGQAPEAHVRVVAAARTQELDTHPQAADLVRRLERAGLLQLLPLAPLEPGQTLALVRAASGTHDGSLFAARLQRATRGNPFHLTETLRFLIGSGELEVQPDGRWHTRYDEATADYAELPVPPTLAATIVERVARLSPAARQLVQAAVLTRRGFTLAQLRPATALDDWQAVDGLEEALRLRLFVEWGDATAPQALPRYRLAHDLTRDAIAPTLRPERRRLIHDRLAEGLAAQGESADHVAWHLDEAGRPDAALPWHLRAAEDARGKASWRGVLWHLECAWAAMATATPDARLACVRSRIDAARRALDMAAMARAIDDLAAEGTRPGAEPLALEALVLRAEMGQLQKAPVPAIAPLRDALEAGRFDAEPALRMRAVSALATALLAAGRLEAAQEVLARGPADDEQLDPALRAGLLSAHANAARLARQPSRALPLLQRALALLQGSAHTEMRLQALNLLAHTQFMGGHAAEAIATLEGALAEAEQARLMPALRTVLPNLVTLHIQHGDLPRARRYLERGMRALRSVDNPATHAALHSRLAELEIHAGRLGAALRAARESIARYERNGGGSQDYAPWLLSGVVFDGAGVGDRTEALFASLLSSPARAPGPGPEALARLKTLAARVPHATPPQALAIADELLALREAPDSTYPASEADFWRARALHRAGRSAQALALAERLDDADLGVAQHGASLWALRLNAMAAAGPVAEVSLAGAETCWAQAPPLAALELAHALVAAHAANGKVAAAQHWAAVTRQAAERLAASLEGEPELAAALLQRWRPPPADPAAPGLR
jgi:DNA-binding SARP family transcriptional activator